MSVLESETDEWFDHHYAQVWRDANTFWKLCDERELDAFIERWRSGRNSMFSHEAPMYYFSAHAFRSISDRLTDNRQRVRASGQLANFFDDWRRHPEQKLPLKWRETLRDLLERLTREDTSTD